MCQDDTSPVVRIEVPVNRLEEFYETIEKGSKSSKKETQDFFANQNPATRKMGKIVSETYDAMVKSMAKEISEVLK